MGTILPSALVFVAFFAFGFGFAFGIGTIMRSRSERNRHYIIDRCAERDSFRAECQRLEGLKNRYFLKLLAIVETDRVRGYPTGTEWTKLIAHLREALSDQLTDTLAKVPTSAHEKHLARRCEQFRLALERIRGRPMSYETAKRIADETLDANGGGG